MFFTPEKDTKIDFNNVDKDALLRLEQARGFANIPFVITSSYRTPEHSVEVGGSNSDAHTKTPCTAFDIAFSNTYEVYLIVTSLLKAGFNRIGINALNKHVHCDTESTLPTPRIWIEGILK